MTSQLQGPSTKPTQGASLLKIRSEQAKFEDVDVLAVLNNAVHDQSDIAPRCLAQYQTLPIDADDGDGDVLRCRSIEAGDGEAVGHRLARVQRLDRALVIVGGVAPCTCGGDVEAAVAVATQRAALGDEAGFAWVGVGDAECAAGDQVAAACGV